MPEGSLDPKNLDKYKKEMKNILKNAKEVNQSFSNWGGEWEKIADLQKAYNDRQAEIQRLTENLVDENGNINKEIEAQLNYEKEKQKLLNTTLKTLRKQISLTRTLGNETVGFLAKQTKLLTGMKDMYYDIDESVRKTSMSLGLSSSRMAQFHNNAMGVAGTYAALGIDVKEAAEAQASYSDQVGRTVMLSQEALGRMGELGKITGMGTQGMAEMAGQMEAFGMGSVVAMEKIGEIRDTAQGMGVNTGKVLKKVQQNMNLLNKLNFKGGVKGLGKMAAYATKFKMDMSALAESARAVWSPEGAIEAAASLQTLGGGFSKLADPFKLMFDARNDPEKYAESITKSLDGIAKFSDGEFIVSAYEMQRLEEAGKALGFSGEQMAEMAKQQAKVKKMGNILGGMTFENEEDRKMLEGMIEFDKKGNALIGDKQLKDLKKEEIDALVERQKSAEIDAKNAMSTREMFNALNNQLMSSLLPIMQALDPILRGIVDTLGTFIKDNPITSGIIAGLGMAIGKLAEWYMKGYHMGIGFNAATTGGKGFFGTLKEKLNPKNWFGKKAAETSSSPQELVKNKVTDPAGKVDAGGKGGVGSSLKSLASGLSAMGTPQVLFGAFNLIPTSIGMIALLPAIPTLLVLGLTPLAQLGTNLTALGTGLSAMSSGLAGAGVLAVAAVGFTLMTAGIIGLLGIATLGAAAGSGLTALGGGLAAFGATAGTVGWLGVAVLVALGAVMMMFGAAVYFVASGIALVVDSFTNMFSVINSDNIGALLLLGPALMMTSLGIMSLAGSLLVMAGAMALGGWLGLIGLAATAYAVKDAFSGIDADGITKSVDAINSVDMDRIEALKELSMAMSLWGLLGSKPIVVQMNVGGEIKLGGPNGETFDVSDLSQQQISELKDLIFQKQRIDSSGGLA